MIYHAGKQDGDTYVEVQDLRAKNVIVDDLDIPVDLVLGNIFEELLELRTSDTVGAVDDQGAVDSPALQGANESIGQLMVVSDFADLAVGGRGAFGVGRADQVVQLRSCQDLVVDKLRLSCLQSGGKSRHKGVSGGSSVAAINHLGGGSQIDLEVGRKLVVILNEVFGARGVDELGRIALPVLLEHVAHGIDDLDTVVDGGVVGSGDHYTDGLRVHLATAQGRKQADAEGNALEQVSLHAEPRSAVLVDLSLDNGMLLRCSQDVFVVDRHGREFELRRGSLVLSVSAQLLLLKIKTRRAESEWKEKGERGFALQESAMIYA